MTAAFGLPYISPNNGKTVGVHRTLSAFQCTRFGKYERISMTKPYKSHISAHYRIRLKGCLDDTWSDWFEEMAISSMGAETILTGPIADQAALHGLLIRIRDLNLTLLSVECLASDQEDKK